MDFTLLTASATQLARWIRQRRVTSLQVVQAHIGHIERVNPTLNAVVRDRFEEARAEARQADAQLDGTPVGELPPFWGVPCTIKESFSLAGMPNTSGLLARKGVIALEDATAVARLRRAGAIPLGVTNISELCMWMESNNAVYGRTNNPYDSDRIVGGSSGGEGAIIGGGGSPFGLGSDVGGSIRLPAFFNGVFGHKPTGGLVPGTGQFPAGENEGLRYVTTGPLARRAEDLMPLLKILAGPDGLDEGCRPMDIDRETPSLRELRVLDVEDNGIVPVSRDLQEARRRAVRALEQCGARVRKLRIDGLKHSFGIWSSMLAKATETPFGVLLGQGRRINTGWQLLKWCFNRSPHTLPALGLAFLEQLADLLPTYRDRLVERGRALRRQLLELIGEDGVMLFPTYPKPAPRHNLPMLFTFHWTYTAIFNVMELPVTQVPLGLNRQGIPLGVQVAGVHGNDALTIAVACELERMFGGWVPPPRIFNG